MIEIATSGVNDMQIFRLFSDYLAKSAVPKGDKSILNKQEFYKLLTATLLTNKKINKYSAKAQKVPISLHVLCPVDKIVNDSHFKRNAIILC